MCSAEHAVSSGISMLGGCTRGLAAGAQVAAGSAAAPEKAVKFCKLCWLCGCLQALPQTVAMPPVVKYLQQLNVQQGLAMSDKIQDSNAKASLPDGQRVNIPCRTPRIVSSHSVGSLVCSCRPLLPEQLAEWEHNQPTMLAGLPTCSRAPWATGWSVTNTSLLTQSLLPTWPQRERSMTSLTP